MFKSEVLISLPLLSNHMRMQFKPLSEARQFHHLVYQVLTKPDNQPN